MEKCFYAHLTVQVVWDSSARGVSGRTSYPLKNHVSIYPVNWQVAVPHVKGSEGFCLRYFCLFSVGSNPWVVFSVLLG